MPLFSVVWYGRDRLQSALDCIASVQAQTCSDFEFVVEDSGSTDGTVEAFQQAAARDPRIRISPGVGISSGEGLIDALRRCRGDYIAICPNEGRFLPNALEFAAAKFRQYPDIGGICGKAFLVDAHGASLDDVDIVTLLLTAYRPFLPAGFIRRSALLAAGLNRDGWLVHAFELDLWCRLATDHGIRAFPHDVVEADRSRQVGDGLHRNVELAIEDTLLLISRVFSSDGFFGGDSAGLALESKAHQLSILWASLRAQETSDGEYLLFAPFREVVRDFRWQLSVDRRLLHNLHRLTCTRSANLGLIAGAVQKLLARAHSTGGRLATSAAYAFWQMPRFGQWAKEKVIILASPSSEFDRLAPSRAEMYADVYDRAANRYEARGQIGLALEMWERARPPNDLTRDSIACQAILKLPEATDASLAAFQKKWVERHTDSRPDAWPLPAELRDSQRKIRIGYHCSFMNSDTIRFMMGRVMDAHDRSRFEIYGYAPSDLADDLHRCFDVVRNTSTSTPAPGAIVIAGLPTISDDEFVGMVRADKIDVLVEWTGFSTGHRFVAMSRRCAPVQATFLNHTGTSEVPNVDYVLSDSICLPPDSTAQEHYSERIWRLPGSFFCFDYRGSDSPPIVEPPALARQSITFGCFGSGGKFNTTMIDWWSRLLKRVPGSILRLQNAQLNSRDTRRYLVERFHGNGIGIDRLLLAGGVGRRLLLDAYNQVDISLDTWPYCGGNTIAESLWMGVPVVTLRGDRFGSRYGASLVTAAGCSDLIAGTPEQYIDIAAGLANDLPRLRTLRRDLRRMFVEHGLGDSARFARGLESAYTEMLERLR